MTRATTFLHTADLHLGAPIRGLGALSDEWAARLRTAIAESFDRVVRCALQRAVDFVVIAGDSFDSSHASYRDFLRFFDGLSSLHEAGIPAYLVTGNHDPFTSWTRDVDRLPPTAHLLGIDGPSFSLFERDGEPLCLIGGRSYRTQVWSADEGIATGITRDAAVSALSREFAHAADAPFSVGVIHTGLDVDQQKAPADEDTLLGSGIDYWACGHLHKRLVRPSLYNPRIAFPGCIQGRDAKETGERGCFIVTLEEGGAPQLEFVPTASVVMQSLQVEVSTARTLADLERHIQAELFRIGGMAHCEEMVARVTLIGRSELHGYLADSDVRERLRRSLNDSYPSFFCDSLVDRTEPVGEQCGEGDRLAAGPFPALVGRMATVQRLREEEAINYVQSELVKRGVPIPGSLTRRIGEFIDTAERTVLDFL